MAFRIQFIESEWRMSERMKEKCEKKKPQTRNITRNQAHTVHRYWREVKKIEMHGNWSTIPSVMQ